MQILILTQYYLPETGAPQNRLSSLAHHLHTFGNNVEVLTAMPNYPLYEIFEPYKGKKYYQETIANIVVHRAALYVSKKKNILHRLLNYFSFTKNAYYTARKKIQPAEVIICESPPLFLGITAVALKKKWNCKLIFNVSDLWPESAEKMGIIKNKFLLQLSYKLANWIYKNADLISGQTKGIIEAIQAMQPAKKLYWLPNGVDIEKFEKNNFAFQNTTGNFTLLYAGIIGHAQGLEVILHAADKLRNNACIHFYIIGDGPVKKDLVQLQQALQLTNVFFLPTQPNEKIIEWLHRCDAYIVPLKKLDLFKGAIPSKLFEPLALGKPILLGVDGEAKELFINHAAGGLYFEPENPSQLSEVILTLYNSPSITNTLGNNGRQYVYKNFSRSNIALQFWQQIQQL